MFESAAVGIALDEAGGDAAVLADVGDALEGGEPPVDSAAENEQKREVHHPYAEARVAAALGEDGALLRRLDPEAAPAQRLGDGGDAESAGRRRHPEAQSGDVIEPPLGIAHQVPDARQPLERAGDQVERERGEQQREPPGVEQVVQLEVAVGPEQPPAPGEGALDVLQRVVLRVDEGAGDHREKEQQQIDQRQPQRAEEAPDALDDDVALLLRERTELRHLADGVPLRACRDQLFRGAHGLALSHAARRVESGLAACACFGLRASRSAVQ